MSEWNEWMEWMNGMDEWMNERTNAVTNMSLLVESMIVDTDKLLRSLLGLCFLNWHVLQQRQTSITWSNQSTNSTPVVAAYLYSKFIQHILQVKGNSHTSIWVDINKNAAVYALIKLNCLVYFVYVFQRISISSNFILTLELLTDV